MDNILIKSLNIVSVENDEITRGDILIKNGVITDIAPCINAEDAVIKDAGGLYAFPGIVDIHVHLRDPGQTYKEDILSGCEAAAAGGVTAVAAMPNTLPAADSPETVSYIVNKAKNAKARVFPIAAISQGLQGTKLNDFAVLKKAGAIALSDDGKPVEERGLFAQALRTAYDLNLLVIAHCEVMKLADKGIINEGEVSKRLGVPGIPRASEDEGTSYAINLAEQTKTRVHIAHVSTKGSVEIIKDAQARGVNVTAETAPHYFTLTEDELKSKNANFRMNPPLRTHEDREAVIAGLKDGTIEVIATDHAPHAPDEKSDFLTAPNGIIGLETSLAVTLTALYHEGSFSLNSIARLMSRNGAKLLNIPHCTFTPGSVADIAIVDISREWVVDSAKFRSRSCNSPYAGRKLKGKVVMTVCGGEVVYEDEAE